MNQESAPQVSCLEPIILFILGSPRVGSTVLFQLIINHFECFFPSNSFNRIFQNKEVNLESLDLSLHMSSLKNVSYNSDYGKTFYDGEPSEASAFFGAFFGGEHPSEEKSKSPLPDLSERFIDFCRSLYRQSQKPLVFKNAWNCFRISYLSQAIPNACFLWIRRDIADAAFSDLEARKKRGSTNIWNSATTADYFEIQKHPYWEQVVEQQYGYARRVGSDLSRFCRDRYLEVWYEDLLVDPNLFLKKIQNFLSPRGFIVRKREIDRSDLRKSNTRGKMLRCEDGKKILSYANSAKFIDSRRTEKSL